MNMMFNGYIENNSNYQLNTTCISNPGPLLLTWIDFNPIMDK